MHKRIKISIDSLKAIVLALFSVILFSIDHIYILNVFVVFFLIVQIVKTGSITLWNSTYRNYLLAYVLWVVLDVMIILCAREYDFRTRNFVQVLFDIQYLILLMKINMDVETYVNWVIKIATIYSCFVIYEFFATETYMHWEKLYVLYRAWGSDLFPGGLNYAAIPFVFALFLTFYFKDNFLTKILISFGGVLFPSRVSMFGISIIWLWFLGKEWKRMCCQLKVASAIMAVFMLFFSLNVIHGLAIDEYISKELVTRLTITLDREDIVKEAIYFAEINPFSGYGGRTLEQIRPYYPSYSGGLLAWPHTHNVLLEPLIRYGIIGMVLFTSFLVNYFLSIHDKELKFFLILMFLMGMFQTYFRAFYFIYFILVIKMVDTRKVFDDGKLL